MRYRKKPELSLSNAPLSNLYAEVTCRRRCRVTHLYHPDDLLELCKEDLAIPDVAEFFRCERCRSRDYMRSAWKAVYGPDTGKTPIRRLVRVRYVRVPVWRDDVV